MSIATRLDEGGRAAWIATMIVGFIIFWPDRPCHTGLHDMERKNGLQKSRIQARNAR